MKVLIVSNEGQRRNRVCNPVIDRLVNALNNHPDIEEARFCPFSNRLSDFTSIRRMARSVDVIHIQFGGLYALLVWFSLLFIHKPKLLTFHGTDIHAKEIRTTKSFFIKLKIWLNQRASFLSLALFNKLGFVTDALYEYIPKRVRRRYSNKFFIQSLGVDYSSFYPIPIHDACFKLGLPEGKYVLFSDKSGTKLKRKDLAEEIVRLIGNEFELLVMCGVSPSEVPWYINASDFVLLTSDEEGSPNIVREALALNKRVFSVDVGDVRQQLSGLKNSAIIDRDPFAAAALIMKVRKEPYVDNTRESLYKTNNLSSTTAALVTVYSQILKKHD